jgi:tRNA-specific 2-thiouridylase
LWVVQGHDHPWLLSEQLHAQDLSWVSGQAPSASALAAKTRYRQTDAPCHVPAIGPDLLSLRFDPAHQASALERVLPLAEPVPRPRRRTRQQHRA